MRIGVEALRSNEHLRNGLTVYRGAITRREAAEALGLGWTDAAVALQAEYANV